MIETGPLVPQGIARAEETLTTQGTVNDTSLVHSDSARAIAPDTERDSDARFARCGTARSRPRYLQYYIQPFSLLVLHEAATNQRNKRHIAARNRVMGEQNTRAIGDDQVVSGLIWQ